MTFIHWWFAAALPAVIAYGALTDPDPPQSTAPVPYPAPTRWEQPCPGHWWTSWQRTGQGQYLRKCANCSASEIAYATRESELPA